MGGGLYGYTWSIINVGGSTVANNNAVHVSALWGVGGARAEEDRGEKKGGTGEGGSVACASALRFVQSAPFLSVTGVYGILS